MTKRSVQSWYLLGRNVNYDFTPIKQIRKSIKNLKLNIKHYTNYINELESCTTLNNKIKSVQLELKKLKNSIDHDQHIQFLNSWRVVGRLEYGLNLKALTNCRTKINELIRSEFIKISDQAQLEIIELENKIQTLQDQISKTKLESGPIIAKYQAIIDSDKTTILNLKYELEIEVIKLKNYLQSIN
jgi:hypothetical protein